MTKISIGTKVDDFTLPATDDKNITLSALTGKNVIVYFYPKDSTPGCTREGLDFQNNIRKFRARNSIVLGVSRDSIKSHQRFREKQGFTFDLLADEDGKLCQQFNVIKQKNLYGRKVMGIERSTFLIDVKGLLRQEWRKVRVDGHVAEVLAAIKTLC